MLNLITSAARRTRQHHALEHATISTLAHRLPGRRISGVSDPFGFTLFAGYDQAQVQKAVSDAMLRLQAGESSLAIHPNCGTNLTTAGFLAAGAATLSRLGKRDAVTQFLRTALFVLPALVIAQPLGLRLQEYTTLADVADRWLVGVRTMRLGPVTVHRVVLR